MNIKTIAATAGLALSMAVTSANAAPAFALNGGYNGEINIKFSNAESFNTPGPALGALNFGVLGISDIRNPATNAVLWNEGTLGAELTGVFRDIKVSSIVPTGLTSINVDSTGGILDIYINPVNSFSAVGGFSQGLGGYGAGGCAIGGACYNGISNVVGGQLFLALQWVPGVSLTDPLATVAGNFTGATLPATGSAQGFLKVVGGAYAANFDNNGFLSGAADVFSQNDFCTPGQQGCDSLLSSGGPPALGGWQLRSNDPVRTAFKTVPEPGSLALLGLGLSAFGFTSKRRRRS